MALNPTKEKDVSNLIGKESADPSNQVTNSVPTNINQNIVPPNSNLQNFLSFLQTPGNTTTIPVSNLKTLETPIKVPPPPTTPTTNILGQSVDSAVSGFIGETETQANKNKLTEGLNKIIGNIENQNSNIADITEQEGLTAKDTARRKATADLTAIDKAYLDEVAKIKENKEGKFGGAIEQDIQRATDAYNNRRANSVIVANYALGDYQAALDTVNLKVNALKDQNAQSIQAYQLLSNSVMNDLTESEKLQVQANLQQKKDQADLVNGAYERVLANAVQNNAPASILSAIDEAARRPGATAVDISKAAGRYGADRIQQLQAQKLQLDATKTQAEINALNETFDFTQLGAGDVAEQTIASSSKYGDQRLTDTQLLKIQQATNALGSIENLRGLLSQGKDGVSLTGPVTGRVRELITKLGGDADASAINATIQGLIPTIARGIFGEVGVLTNADIENYKKTVPNLTSSAQQNKLVTLIMYDVLARSLQNTLVSNAQNQTNVSNFLPSYQRAIATVENAKSELGVTSLSGLDNNELLDSVPESSTPYNFSSLTNNNFWSTFSLPQ